MPGDAISAAPSESDYQNLYQLSMSPDANERATAGAIAKTLSFQEQQDFFAYQQSVHRQARGGAPSEITRADSSGGEMLVAGGAGLAAGRSVVMPAATTGIQAVSKIKDSIASAHPLIRYQVTKGILTSAGVPAAIAEPIAFAVGFGGRTGATAGAVAAGGAAADTAGASTAEPLNLGRGPSGPAEPPPTTPPASPPAPRPPGGRPIAPPAAPQTTAPLTAAPSGPTLKILGALKQAGYSDAELTQAATELKRGVAPAEVVKRIDLARQLSQSGSFAHLPDNLEAAQAITPGPSTNPRYGSFQGDYGRQP